MVTNVYTKSNYDRLRIDKALGFRKSDNNKKHKDRKSMNDIRGYWGPSSGFKNDIFSPQGLLCNYLICR